MKPKPIVIALVLLAGMLLPAPALAQTENPDPPSETVRLIFIHHSCGENWLSDGNGDLGRALAENGYFVSDTNYGWGPDSIGDATDYHNWYDWFLGPESPRYLAALYAENGQNSAYTRPLADPGGENQVVMFKSCFPNSDLSGAPNDPPNDDEWFSVGHAKYVYTQLLDYFVTRPDKLFIAITPPPLLDATHAANARAFSRWLVTDWLAEYPLNNVAVWDFHNLLTHPDNHHRYVNGAVEYVIDNGNGTLYYDSDGDEHPNPVGNQKATGEFVPMLNIFYHRWMAEAPQVAPVDEGAATPEQDEQAQPEAGEATTEQGVAQSDPGWVFGVGALVDDFESGPPPGTEGWQAFRDDANPQTSLACAVDNNVAQAGAASLRIDFHIQPESWATCALMYASPPGYGDTTGIAFDYRADAAARVFNLDVYGGSPQARSSYHYVIESVPESVDGWVHVELPWEQIVRVEWEENPGTPVNPAEINGFALGFSTYPDTPNDGTIWIDNLEVIEHAVAPTPEPAPAATEAAAPSGAAPPQPENRPPRLCPGASALIGVSLLGGVWVARKKPRPDA